ncbi:MAG: HAD family phosphatase [Actinomycetia bacterium]|nr:HAD family phosphatase [Actinomycetes bacterium]
MGADPEIRFLLSDVDGTLVRSDKSLSDATVAAIGRLRDAGIHFAVTSGRPPKGMEMLVEPLALVTPMAAFNGGEFVTPQLEPIETRVIEDAFVPGIIELIDSFGLDAWVYSGADWFVLDSDGYHVDVEASTVQFQPTQVASFSGIDSVAKVVGVGEDHDAVARAEAAAREKFGSEVSAARSQPYYLDVTHPDANKGGALQYLADRYDIAPESFATIGDMPNDVLMFARGGLGIAMGNAGRDVQRAARHVTLSNDDDGVAHAIDRFILGAS